MLVSCVNTSEPAETVKSVDSSLEKNTLASATFPNGFEALILEVCDESEIAELKMKVGDFEMHLKRNIGVTKTPTSFFSPSTPPPVPSKLMIESAPAASAASPPKSSSEKISPFKNVAVAKSSKLEALEASGSNAYVLVSSPTVFEMFFFSEIEHKLHLPPQLLSLPFDVAIEGELEGISLDKGLIKYYDASYCKVGLCVSVYGIKSIDGCFIMPGEGAPTYTKNQFLGLGQIGLHIVGWNDANP